MSASLPPPRRYVPFLTERYTVSAGLSKLDAEPAFEVDTDYASYLAEKHRLLSSDSNRHHRTNRFPAELERAVVGRMVDRLQAELPGVFPEGDARLAHALEGGGLDAIARSVQEDIVVIRRDPGDGGRDWNAAIHVCFPNGWSPEEKIGRSFFETHVPVAGIKAVNDRAREFVGVMIAAREGLKRFVWGVRTDDRLDHHPESPSDVWNPGAPRLWVRVERQVVLGMPEHEAAIFLIRTYLNDVTRLSALERGKLAEGIEGMSEESAAYKGIAATRSEMVAWLRSF